MLHLQAAEIQNSQQWLKLVEENRATLEYWMPHLKEIQTLEDAQGYIHKNACLDIYLGEHIFEIWEGENIVGLVSLHNGRMINKSVDLGYWLGGDYIGRGLMTDACQILISHTFVRYPVDIVFIRCEALNYSSIAVAQRLGFELSKKESCVFSMSKTTWMENYYEDTDLFGVLEDLNGEEMEWEIAQ